MRAAQNDQPSLIWLAGAEATTLAGSVDGAAETLVAVVKNWAPGTESPEIDAALENVLRATAEQGSGAIDRADAIKLAFPALTYLEKSGSWSSHTPVLRMLARRKELLENHRIRQLLEAYVEEPQAVKTPSVARDLSHSDRTGRQMDLPTSIGELGVLLIEHSPEELAIVWAAGRHAIVVAIRAEIDAALLQLLQASRMPTPLAEALYEDVEVWDADPLLRWARDLADPLEPSVHGTAAAALLNARVRSIRPRIFLRHPKALIVDEIGAKMDDTRLKAELASEVAEPLLRALKVFLTETERSRPRKKPLQTAQLAVSQIFQRLGLALEGEFGATVQYDPIRHLASEPLEVQTSVIVHRPGVVEEATGSVLIKAHVDEDQTRGDR